MSNKSKSQQTPPPPSWPTDISKSVAKFAKQHKLTINQTQRQLSASFEIGCLHSIINFYKQNKYNIKPENLHNNAYKYLTTPSGNPNNFSYLSISGPDGDFEIRQQVRIESHISSSINFTPDIVVLKKDRQISSNKNKIYANGKKSFFSVKSEYVVAAHECKSMNPFPELLVSFIGMLQVAHKWHPSSNGLEITTKGHLAPTLFVGGTTTGLHRKMIDAMQEIYNLNIVSGMHSGTWKLTSAKNRFLIQEGLKKKAIENLIQKIKLIKGR